MNNQTSLSWKQASHRVRIAAITLLVLLAIFIIWQTDSDDGANVAVSTPTPTVTAVPTPSLTPKLVPVVYQVAVNDNEGAIPFVDLWYSSGPEQRDQERGRRISAEPYSIEVQVSPGTFVELFATLQSNLVGTLTCRIIVADTVIQESTSQGQGAGAYCGGPVTQ